MWLIATTITLFIANVRVMADEYSWTFLQYQPSSCTAVQVADLNSDYLQTTTHRFQQIHVQRQMWIVWKIPPTKATKNLPVFHLKCPALLNDSSQTYIICNIMTVRYEMCSFRKISWMKTDIHLRKNFDLHELRLWLLIDRLIAKLWICVSCHIWN